jgi:hypothetical protein
MRNIPLVPTYLLYKIKDEHHDLNGSEHIHIISCLKYKHSFKFEYLSEIQIDDILNHYVSD